LKNVGLAAALVARRVPDPTAHLAVEVGSSPSSAATPSGQKATAMTPQA